MYYLRLGLLAVLFAVCVAMPTRAESADVTVSGIVAGPPPSTPPLITQPIQGQVIDQKTITAEGDCVTDLIVKLFRNTSFAGSTVCRSDGRFVLMIDLVEARNDLIARQYDSLNQPSPDSDTVTVFYAAPTMVPAAGDQSAPPSSPTANFQLIVNYDQTVQNIFTGQTFTLPIRFSGGTPPYAVAIDWGDTKTDLFSRSDGSLFSTSHVYEVPGSKTLVMRVSDGAGNTAYLQFVVLIQGTPHVSVAGGTAYIQAVPVVLAAVGLGGVLVIGFAGGFGLGFWLLLARIKKS